jgi:4-amino-4-deoxy-L-arabinose transferase-like glycosyltransferase
MEPEVRASTAGAPPLLVEVERPRRLAERVAEAPAGVWLAALVAASALARFLVALRSPVPWIFPDEWIYAELARSFADLGHFQVWDVDWAVRTSGPLYPLLMAPAYRLADSPEHAYVLMRALSCVLMSLAAVPAYLLARRVVDRRRAFLASVLTLLVPSMAYTSKVMTENVAYPLFLTVVLAFVRVLERPSAGGQLAALSLIALGILSRGEMVVLVPVYLCSILTFAVLERRADQGAGGSRTAAVLRTYRVTWMLVCVGVILALTLPLAAGSSPATLLGVHEVLLGKIRLAQTPEWLLYHVAELDLAVGVVPFAAFLLVFLLVARGWVTPRPARVFIAVSVSSFVWFVLLAGVYATQPRPEPHVFERYVFYVMPLLLITLLFWVESGLPRPRRATILATLLACVLPLTLPYSTLLNEHEWGVSTSTAGLVPWALLRPVLGVHEALYAAIFAVTAGLAWLFLRCRPERSGLVAMAVLCNLWIVTLFVASADSSASRGAEIHRAAAPDWVDETVGATADVSAIWPGADSARDSAYDLLETQFFNRSVRRLYDLGKPIKNGIPSQPLVVSDRVLHHGGVTGRPFVADYVLAPETLPIAGVRVARDSQTSLVLYQVGGPVSLRR